MTKAAVEGRSASDIVRGSIFEFLRGPRHASTVSIGWWTKAGAICAAGSVLLLAYPASSPGMTHDSLAFEAARARLAMSISTTLQRKQLA
ncbi:MAG: hypothetical protein ABIN83_04000, partial [Sphingomicrobium sp.]